MAEQLKRPMRAEPWPAFSSRVARGGFTVFEKARALSLALEDEWKEWVAGQTQPYGHFTVRARPDVLVVECLTETAEAMPRIQFLKKTRRFGGTPLEVRERKKS